MAKKTLVLIKDVKVAGDGHVPPAPLRTLAAGTPRDEIAESELAQLHDDHFREVEV